MQVARKFQSRSNRVPARPVAERTERSPAPVVNIESLRQKKLLAQGATILDRQVNRAMAKVGFCCEEDEIRSAAYVGLLEAVQRFDAARGIPFEAFAQHRIYGAILDELRSRDTLRRLSRHRARAVQQTREKLVRKLNREPSEQELAKGSGESLETFRERSARERSQTVVSLEELSDLGWQEFVAADGPSADEELSAHEVRSALANALRQLPERLQQIVTWYYRDERSYREIGESLGVSESRVCQLVKGLQATLREALAAYAA